MNENAMRLPLPHESEHETKIRLRFADLLDSSPIPPAELVDNLGLYLRCQPLADLLKQDALYRMVIDVPGAIMEFGVHRGRHLATLTALRAHYEPFNPHRHLIGFDTFSGFPEVDPVDQADLKTTAGRFALPDDYLDHLREVLAAHQDSEHLNHLRRTHIVPGDIRRTLPRFLESNPHTVIALAGLAGEESKWFADLAGTWREEVVNEQHGPGGTSRSRAEHERSTITAAEVRTLDAERGEALIVHASTPAIKTHMRRHYQSREAKEYERSAAETKQMLGRGAAVAEPAAAVWERPDHTSERRDWR